jgi:hypothetical protein
MEQRQVVGMTGQANQKAKVTDCGMSLHGCEMVVAPVDRHILPGIGVANDMKDISKRQF